VTRRACYVAEKHTAVATKGGKVTARNGRVVRVGCDFGPVRLREGKGCRSILLVIC